MAHDAEETVLSIGGHEVHVTHPDKPYFARDAKLTKLDLVNYYLSAEAFLRWACRKTADKSNYDRYPQAVRDIVKQNALAIIDEIAAGTGEALDDKRIASINRPMTLIKGALSDPIFSKAADRLVRLSPQAKVITVPGAGHAVHLEDPRAFAAAVRCAEGSRRQ